MSESEEQECCCGLCSLQTGVRVVLWYYFVTYILCIIGLFLIDTEIYDTFVVVMVFIHVTFGAIVSAVGIYGDRKEQPQLLRPFYYFMIYGLVLLVIELLYVIFTENPLYEGRTHLEIGIIAMIGVRIYVLIIIGIYYKTKVHGIPTSIPPAVV